jgi:hypothetical protein
MASTVKKIVITALASGGVVAGVATASAAPLHGSPSPVAATSAEAARLHNVVVGLTAREQALEAALLARHHDLPTTTVAPAGAAVAVSTAVAPAPAPVPTVAPIAPTVVTTTPATGPADDRSGVTSESEPTTEPDEESTTTTGPGSTTTSTSTTRPDDGGAKGAHD